MPVKNYRSTKISSEAIFATPSMRFSRFILGAFLSFLLIIADLNTQISSYIRGFSQDLLRPVYFIAEFPRNIYNILDSSLNTRIKLNKKIDGLEEQIVLLQINNLTLNSIKRENTELKSLIEKAQDEINLFLFVTKTNFTNNSYNPVLTVKFKKNDILGLNQAVLSKQGLVGKVSSVGRTTAEVQLISDPNSLIPFLGIESGLHGIVQGKGFGQGGSIINSKKTAQYKKGELLVTSGLGGDLPAGYPIGYIDNISDLADSNFLDISVNLTANPSDADLFLIFNSSLKDNE